MTIGFAHSNYVVAGLVGDIDWGAWGVADQKSFAFGVMGTSSIAGGLSLRPFAFPMFIWGYADPPTRDGVIFQLELKLGTIGGFSVTTGIGTIVNIPANVRLANIKPGKAGWDGVHLFWRQLFFEFEELQPPAAA